LALDDAFSNFSRVGWRRWLPGVAHSMTAGAMCKPPLEGTLGLVPKNEDALDADANIYDRFDGKHRVAVDLRTAWQQTFFRKFESHDGVARTPAPDSSVNGVNEVVWGRSRCV